MKIPKYMCKTTSIIKNVSQEYDYTGVKTIKANVLYKYYSFNANIKKVSFPNLTKIEEY